MRNFIKVVLVFLFVGPLVSLASAEVTSVNEKTGEISVEAERIRLVTSAEQEAIVNPGKEVPVDLSPAPSQAQGFWWLTPVQTYSKIVVFTDHKLVWLSKAGKVVGQREIAVYKIFLLLAVGSMLLSNWFFWEKEFVDTFVVAALATGIVALAVLVAVDTGTTLAALAITLAATGATIAAKNDVSFPYRIFSVIFYLLATVALFI